MPSTTPTTIAQRHVASHGDIAMLYVSLELNRKTWLVTSLASGSDKMSKHKVEGGDHCGFLDLLRRLQSKAAKRLGLPVKIVTIQEAGFDGFWLDRRLRADGPRQSDCWSAGNPGDPRLSPPQARDRARLEELKTGDGRPLAPYDR